MNARSATKTKSTRTGSGEKLVAVNRRAFHEYFIEEQIESGIVLTGTEIKSVRAGKVNLREAHARVERGEMWLFGMHISPYGQAGDYFQHDPVRPRKLLLHRTQIAFLAQRIQAKGYTLVPLRLALRNGRAKIDIGLAKGKRDYDKREVMAERDSRREIEQALRRRD